MACRRTDPQDLTRVTEQTRELGLVVCRGTLITLICPVDGMEEIGAWGDARPEAVELPPRLTLRQGHHAAGAFASPQKTRSWRRNRHGAGVVCNRQPKIDERGCIDTQYIAGGDRPADTVKVAQLQYTGCSTQREGESRKKLQENKEI